MITTANINHRLEYIDKVIALYENERTTLRTLAQIYKDPIYKDVRELEKLLDHSKIEYKQPVSIPQTLDEMLSRPKEQLPYADSPSFMRIMHWIYENTITTNNGKYHEVRLTIDPHTAKLIGVSSGTLSKFVSDAREDKYLVKTGKRGWYTVNNAFYQLLSTEVWGE